MQIRFLSLALSWMYWNNGFNFPELLLDCIPKYISQATLSHTKSSLNKNTVLAEDAFGGRKSLDDQTIEHLAVMEFFSQDVEKIAYQRP